MNLDIHVTLGLTLPGAAPAVLQIEAADLPEGRQTVTTATLTVNPPAETERFTDFYDNPCRRLLLPQGDVHLEYTARVALTQNMSEPPPSAPNDVLHLPSPTLLYLLPSRYCPSDRLLTMAAEMFGAEPPGLPQVQKICRWIYEHVAYQYGTSDASTSACDTVFSRVGVCRDFAHLGIAFCRALSLPARYVSGYCLGLEQPDFHAYFEAFLGGQWLAFDATVNEPRRALVQVAAGRDAADCAWSTLYGPGKTTAMTVDVREAAPESV